MSALLYGKLVKNIFVLIDSFTDIYTEKDSEIEKRIKQFKKHLEEGNAAIFKNVIAITLLPMKSCLDLGSEEKKNKLQTSRCIEGTNTSTFITSKVLVFPCVQAGPKYVN